MTTYKRQRYLLMTTDPVHIGTGGYRLGRVDNSIVREPGTRVPKIPGTSLHGAARSYAAMQYESPLCAGQGQPKEGRSGHCAQESCPICYTFGYLQRPTDDESEEKTIAYSGVVNVFDAQVLLFPVHSMAGPVWVSTVARLREAGFSVGDVPDNGDVGAALLTWARTDPLNLGWLMVSIGGQVTVTAPDRWKNTERWKAVCGHLVLVQESLFSQVVNSNLEVRTSVSIDPATGAAEKGALFTYEALPRGTVLQFPVTYHDPQHYVFPTWNEAVKRVEPEPFPKDRTAAWVQTQVEKGLALMEYLGVGGMNTRGFGRLKVLNLNVEGGK